MNRPVPLTTTVLVFAGVAMMMIAGPVFAPISAAAPKPTSDVPATTTISDIDVSTGIAYRIGSDALGTYTNGTDSVESIVQGIGNWELATNLSPIRRVRIDFGDPVQNSGANPPFQAAFVPVRFISKCTTSIFTLALNQSIICPLALGQLIYNGSTYAVRANSNYPGTGTVTWTCLARNSTKCISWKMIPTDVQADGQRKTAMQLIRLASSRRDTDQLLGQFYMSFDIGVTTP